MNVLNNEVPSQEVVVAKKKTPLFKRKYFKIVIILIVILIAGGLFVGWNVYSENQIASHGSIEEINGISGAKRIRILEKREKIYEEKVANWPPNVQISDRYMLYIQLADTRNLLGKYQAAIDALKPIDYEKSNNTRLWAAFTVAYQALGDIANAKITARKALDIDDERADLWTPFLSLSADLPNDQLKALYLQAITKTKSNVDVMISYAKFSEKIGDKATAIAAWETARNVDPDNASKYESEIARLR